MFFKGKKTENTFNNTSSQQTINDAAAFRNGVCPFCRWKFFEEREKNSYTPAQTKVTLYSDNTWTKTTTPSSSSSGRIYRVCHKCNYSYPVGETYWNPCRMEVGYSGIATASYSYECMLNEAQKQRVRNALIYLKNNT